MIDFRYHLVSLISVFLALAVGIALGAGPLKESIGDTLTGQVDQLRSEKDTLRTDLDAASSELAVSDAYLTAAGPALVGGTLTDRRVAVVALGEVPSDRVEAVDKQLTDAGATITAHATVDPAWTDPDQRSFRQAFVGSLLDYLDPKPADDAGVDVELAEALVQALAGADPAAPDQLSADAASLIGLLASGDDPLVTFDGDVTVGADAIVLLAPTLADDSDTATADSDDADEARQSLIAIAQAAQQRSEGAVLVDGPRVDGSLVSTVLGDGDLSDAVTTVSDADGIAGQLNIPLALNARIGGTNGHYGSGDGQTAVPTATVLAPVDRTPVAPEGPVEGTPVDGEAQG